MNICDDEKPTMTRPKFITGNLYCWKPTLNKINICVEQNGKHIMICLNTGLVVNTHPESNNQFHEYTDVTDQYCLKKI